MSTRQPGAASRRAFLASVGGVGAAVLLAACGRAPGRDGADHEAGGGGPSVGPRKKLTAVGFDYPFTFLPVYAGVTRFARQRAEELGLELKLTNDNAKLEAQVSNLTTWISQGIPAIVSFPLEPTTLEQQAKAAREAGTIWVTYGGNLEHQDASITFSFRKGGQLLGEAAAAWAHQVLGGRGKVAFLVDDLIELGRLRTEGMVEAFTKAAPDMQVVAKQHAVAPDEALTAMNGILSTHPDVNVVLCVTDDAGTGAYQALIQRGRKPDDPKTYVGGQDGGKDALELIQRGTFYRASAALALADIGKAVIDVPKAVADGDANPSAEIPVTLVETGSPQIAGLIAQYS
ncbi:MAG: sugar ABC transporter substrate-binding protein [Micromonosporaceae bacterium]